MLLARIYLQMGLGQAEMDDDGSGLPLGGGEHEGTVAEGHTQLVKMG